MNREEKQPDATEQNAKLYDPNAIEDSNGNWIVGWYDDDEGNSIKDRD